MAAAAVDFVKKKKKLLIVSHDALSTVNLNLNCKKKQ